MGTRLIIEGNAVYEIDEDCQACSRKTSTDTVRKEEYTPEETWVSKRKEEK